ncbi:unnamed protein product [Phytophthora lilii]|uniref:Unnamed protein product n=1 Tax=Phytophthora lilii TaxID=2077276 RepID=A0A9W7CNZ5_9STRA|nr:unnamed protein product [Phytophthora lilii]
MAEVNGPSQEAEDDDHNHDHQAGAQTSDVLLTELCAEWMASVPSHPFLSTPKRSSNWADISALLLVVISAGYAHDFVPLLLELPLLRTSMPFFLARLERFARFSRDHLLLLQLHAELSEALSENTDVVG